MFEQGRQLARRIAPGTLFSGQRRQTLDQVAGIDIVHLPHHGEQDRQIAIDRVRARAGDGLVSGERLVIPADGTPPTSTTRYTVQPGDTLYRIAARYGTTVTAIATANNITDPNLIRPGQVLIINR